MRTDDFFSAIIIIYSRMMDNSNIVGDTADDLEFESEDNISDIEDADGFDEDDNCWDDNNNDPDLPPAAAAVISQQEFHIPMGVDKTDWPWWASCPSSRIFLSTWKWHIRVDLAINGIVLF